LEFAKQLKPVQVVLLASESYILLLLLHHIFVELMQGPVSQILKEKKEVKQAAAPPFHITTALQASQVGCSCPDIPILAYDVGA